MDEGFIVAILIVYMIPAIFSWRWIYLAHSPRGIYNKERVDFLCIVIIFCPIINCLGLLASCVESPIKPKERRNYGFSIRSIIHYIITFGGYEKKEKRKFEDIEI